MDLNNLATPSPAPDAAASTPGPSDAFVFEVLTPAADGAARSSPSGSVESPAAAPVFADHGAPVPELIAANLGGFSFTEVSASSGVSTPKLFDTPQQTPQAASGIMVN